MPPFAHFSRENKFALIHRLVRLDLNERAKLTQFWDCLSWKWDEPSSVGTAPAGPVRNGRAGSRSNLRNSFIKDMSRQLVARAAKLSAHVILRLPLRRGYGK